MSAREVGILEAVSVGDIGRYRIEGTLGVGGMGEVYRASLETLDGVGKRIAIKVVRPELARERRFERLFVEEAKVAMSLSHANVVQSFDVGKIDERWFIAMELVDGLDLAALLRRARESLGQLIPQRHAVLIAVEALKGLDYSHRLKGVDGAPLGIVHRDVSPSNVLVSLEGEVKIADFGLAKSTLRRGSNPGKVAGKLPYMAPEQLRASAVDARTDIYAMGAVLYELLTGRPAYRASHGDGTIERVLAGDFPRPREVEAQVPDELERIVLRAMATEPADRFPNAAAMRQELERFAMQRGYLLSTSDLADFARALVASDEAGPSRDPSLPRAQPASAGPEAIDDPFDAILGQELVRLPSDAGYSVWVTQPEVKRTASIAPPAPEPRSTESEPPPPARRRRALWLLAPLVLVAAAAALGWIPPTDDVPDPESPTRTSTAPEGDAPEAGSVPDGLEPPAAVEEPGPIDAPPAVEPAPAPAEVVARPPARVEPTPRARRRPARPAEPPAEPAAAPPNGWLSANTTPWSNVYLDGRLLRATPLVRHPVPSGRHTVRFHNPANARERTVTVTVEPGAHERVSLDL